MKRISVPSLLVILLGLIASCGQPTQTATFAPPTAASESLEKTSTGFYWPTGTSNIGDYSGWLSDGCSWSRNYSYYENEFHIGKDIAANVGSPVYAIADGQVLYKSLNGWGLNNTALLIVHSLNDGSSFTAVYGHIRSDLKQGDRVEGGTPFATVGPWPDGSHLHFGIRPGTSLKDPYGRMPCPTQGPVINYNDFVDPIEWITTRSPGEQTVIITPAPLPTPTSVAQAGEIVFTSESGSATVYMMNPNGSGLRRLVGGTMPAWSPDGKQVAFTDKNQVYIANVDGSDIKQVTYEQYAGAEPDFSPDGTKIAFCGNRDDGSPDIYVTDVNSYAPIRLTQGSWNCSPDWSPDGTQIVFDRYIDSTGRIEIFVIGSDGKNMQRLTTLQTYGTVHPAWSPDGKQIAFVSGDLVIMNADGSNLRYLNTRLQPWSPTWSPNGQYIIFNAQSSAGNQEVFIVRSDGSDRPIQVTNIAGANNMWADWSR